MELVGEKHVCSVNLRIKAINTLYCRAAPAAYSLPPACFDPFWDITTVCSLIRRLRKVNAATWFNNVYKW
jgi:hypothetical protein